MKRTLKDGNTRTAFLKHGAKLDQLNEFIKHITKIIKPFGPMNFQLCLTPQGPVIFEINPRFSGTTPIRSLFGANEVDAILIKLSKKNYKYQYKLKEGLVVRYFENKFIPVKKIKK